MKVRVSHRKGQILRKGTRFIEEIDHPDYEYYRRDNGQRFNKPTDISKERRTLPVNKGRADDTGQS